MLALNTATLYVIKLAYQTKWHVSKHISSYIKHSISYFDLESFSSYAHFVFCRILGIYDFL